MRGAALPRAFLGTLPRDVLRRVRAHVGRPGAASALPKVRSMTMPAPSPLQLAAADVALALATGGRAESTTRAYKGALDQVAAFCAAAGIPTGAMRDRELAECLAAASRGGAPGFPRRCGPARMRVIACAVRAAYASQGMPDPWGAACESLMRQVSRTAPAPRRGMALRPNQVRQLVAWARHHGPWWLADVVVVGWAAALRAGELRDAGRLVSPGVLEIRGKTGPRLVPLLRGPSRALCPVVSAARLAAEGGPPSTRAISDALRRAFLALGFEGATAHALRRGWATTAALSGVPLNVVAARLGHADLRSITRYTETAGPPPPLLL